LLLVATFSMCIAVAVHSAHRPLRRSLLAPTSPADFSIAQTLPNSVANLCSTCPFCCRVARAVNSKLRPNPSFLTFCWNVMFSPTLLQQIFFTMMLLLFLRSWTNEIIMVDVLSFVSRNLLKQKSIASSTARSQYLDPPKLFSWTELMSKKIAHLAFHCKASSLCWCSSALTLQGHNLHNSQTDL